MTKVIIALASTPYDTYRSPLMLKYMYKFEKNIGLIMQNGYYQATGAMVTQFNRLDVVANNLANLNTGAFKSTTNWFCWAARIWNGWLWHYWSIATT